MFIELFYLLRKRGLDVSPTEWMNLMAALDMGLAKSSFTEFYYLCRAILVKTEADFDKFDTVFLEYFKAVQDRHLEIPEELLKWLNDPEGITGLAPMLDHTGMDFNQLLEEMKERLKTQGQQYNGGAMHIGALGTSPFGNAGFGKGGIRIGGASKNKSAFMIAGSRVFRDFRNDVVMNERQFQMAFRRLRQFSSRLDVPESELDIDRTIDDTCNSGGHLRVRMKKPRKNTVKLLLLMDSGGSMDVYSGFCTALFKAATKSNHFKDLKVYYFHNIMYDRLYKSPECLKEDSVATRWVLNNIDSSYKVIILGDAAMAPFELQAANYLSVPGEESHSGLEWARMFKKKYKNIVWLNPMGEDENWGNSGTGQFVDTQGMLAREFDMYPFTLKSFDKALKKLLVTK